ncbi:hypothetical protein NC652_029301 [Populus alba x Populus x berolinensis]|nr:hypothetical protein NC652_029301 [Populus alba x Populus x berolinensis]
MLHRSSPLPYPIPSPLLLLLLLLVAWDKFYDDGLTGEQDKAVEESFTQIYTAKSLQKRWYMLGNHDYRGNAEAPVKSSRSGKIDSEVALFDIFHSSIRSIGHHGDTQGTCKSKLLPILKANKSGFLHELDMTIALNTFPEYDREVHLKRCVVQAHKPGNLTCITFNTIFAFLSEYSCPSMKMDKLHGLLALNKTKSEKFPG